MTTPTAPTTAELLSTLRAALADLDNATDGTDAFEDAAAMLADAARDLDTHLTRLAGQAAPDPLTVLYQAANADQTAVLDTLTERAGLIWACRSCNRYRNPHDAETCESCGKQRTWPRRALGGDTVWACCVSSIGPKCWHVMTPEERDAARTELDALTDNTGTQTEGGQAS